MVDMNARVVLSLVDKVTGPARKIRDDLERQSARRPRGLRPGRVPNVPLANSRHRRQRGGQRPPPIVASAHRPPTVAGVANGVIGRGIGIAAAYVGIREGIEGTIIAAMRFEDAMANIRKVINFESPKQFADMKQQIRDLSKQIPLTAVEIADIYAAAGQANIPLGEMQRFAEMTAKVATAWDLGAGETGKALAEMRAALGLSIGDTQLLADAINHLGNNTEANARDILNFEQRVASSAKTYGMASEQAAAFGAAMLAAGHSPEVVATSYRNMLKALGAGGKTLRQKTAMKALGLDPKTVQKSLKKDTVGTILKVFNALKDKIPEHLRGSVISDLFGDEARALTSIIDNTELLEKTLGLVGDQAKYAGSSSREFEESMKRTSATLQLLRNNMADIGISIGDGVLPTLNELAKSLNKVLSPDYLNATVFDYLGASSSGFFEGLTKALGYTEGTASERLGTMLKDILTLDTSDAGEFLATVNRDAATLGESLGDVVNQLGKLKDLLSEISPGLGTTAAAALGLGAGYVALNPLKTTKGVINGAKSVVTNTVQGGAKLVGAGAPAATTGAVAKSTGFLSGFTKLFSGMKGKAGLGVIGAMASVYDSPNTTKEWNALLNKNRERDERASKWLYENIFEPSGLGFLVGKPNGVKDLGLNKLTGRDYTLGSYGGFRDLSNEPLRVTGLDRDPLKFHRAHVGQARLPAARDPQLGVEQPGGVAPLVPKTETETGPKDVSILNTPLSTISQPNGVQDVHVTNPPPAPQITVSVVVNATTNASPQEIGDVAGDAVGRKVASTLEASFLDG